MKSFPLYKFDKKKVLTSASFCFRYCRAEFALLPATDRVARTAPSLKWHETAVSRLV